MRNLLTASLVALGLAGLAAPAAHADRKSDTIHYSSFFATRSLDIYFDENPNTDTMSEAVFDTLVTQDLQTGEIAPLLAKSWTRVSPTVLEFDLRDDVKWHDGEKFTADDVIYTLGWLIDPSTTIPTKPQWSWIEKVEKLGDYKIRLTTKGPTSYDLVRLAYFTPIYPAHILTKLQDKTTFGVKPIGTGPYKAVSVDVNRGFVVEKNPDYKWGGKAKPQNNFQRFEVRGLPDTPAHAARFLVNETDLVQAVGIDVFNQIRTARPNFKHFTVRTGAWQWVGFPASGFKLNPPLANPKVRQALIMAIDRAATEKLRSDRAVVYKSLCENNELGCGFTKAPPDYDVAGAKKLLTEAGYPNGFDVEITTLSTSGTKIAAEAVAGYLSAIGVRAKLAPMIIPQLRQKVAEKKVEILVYADSSGMMPDVSAQVQKLFMGQYWDDPKIIDLAHKVNSSMDDKERRKITAELLDYVTDNKLLAMLNAQSRFYIYNDDVDLVNNVSSFYPEGWAFRQLNWRK